jgi:hypothetical protein
MNYCQFLKNTIKNSSLELGVFEFERFEILFGIKKLMMKLLNELILQI